MYAALVNSLRGGHKYHVDDLDLDEFKASQADKDKHFTSFQKPGDNFED
jgi:hypothetical protein